MWYSLSTSAHRTTDALGLRIALSSLCAKNECCHLVFPVSHPLVVLSRAFLHEHFLFFTCLSHHKPRTLSTSRTSPSSLSRSRITLAWRPAECRNLRNTTPTGCEPNEFVTVSTKLVLEIHMNCLMYKKNLEKKIFEFLSPKKWRNSKRLGRLPHRILIRDVLLPIADAIRLFLGKHCRL